MKKDIIKTELTEVRDKFAKPRQTEISMDFDDIDIEDLIEKEDVVISLTHSGYIKRQPVNEYRTQKRGGVGVAGHKTKEDDFVEKMFISNTHDNLLFFTSKGRVFCQKTYVIPEAQKSAKGRAIINLLHLGQNETVTEILRFTSDLKGYLVMATKKGLIKKTAIEEFRHINKNGKIAIKLVEDDQLISVDSTNGRDEIIVATHFGKCIRFSEENVRKMGRSSQGVKSISLSKSDYVVDMSVIKKGYQILTISENGYGKRSDPNEYRLQTRGGKGIKAGIFNEKTGKLVNLKQIKNDQDVILISDNGTIIRIMGEEINKISRNTQGVKIMRLKDKNYKVVCSSVTEHVDEEEEVEENTENQEQ